MGVLLALLRSTWRSGWRGLMALALLIAVASGAVMSGAAAARRTDSAFDRLVATTKSWDLLVNPDQGLDSALTVEGIAAVDGVAEVGRVDGVSFGPARATSLAELESGPINLASDGHALYDVGRPVLREGRLPDRDAVDEVFVSAAAADDLGVDVGDLVPVKVLTPADFGALQDVGEDELLDTYNDPSVGRRVDLRVTGIGTLFDEIVVEDGFGGGSLVVPPAFYEAFDEPAAGFWGGLVRVDPDVDVDDVRSAIEALAPGESIAFQTRPAVADQFSRSVQPYVDALVVFTLLAGAVGLVVVGQAAGRRLQQDGHRLRALRPLGVTGRQLTALGVARVAIAAALGAAGGVAIAVGASPIAPLGPARAAEPAPGVHVDVAVSVAGALATVIVFVAVAAWPAHRASSRIGLPSSRAGAGDRAARLGLPPATATGVRFALDRSRSGAVSTSTLAGAATSIALVGAMLAIAANLDHFVATPALYGTPWDAVFDVVDVDRAEGDAFVELDRRLAARSDVRASAVVLPGQMELDGRSLPAVAFQATNRPVSPTLAEGRLPVGAGEIALGAATMGDLGVDIGDAVVVSRGGREGRLEVVGEVVLPALGAYPGSDKTTLGDGVLAAPAVLADWSPSFDAYGVVVDLDPGVRPTEVADSVEGARLRYVGDADQAVPADVRSLARVRATPVLLTVLLVALLAMTVVHALVAAVRARRGELAVLRSLGFTRGQVLAAGVTHAMVIAGVGLAVGIPLGLVAGRLTWRAQMARIGAISDLVTPVPALAVLTIVVIGLAIVVGLVPAARATRPSPAAILRTE